MTITGERSQLLSESIPSSGIWMVAKRRRDSDGEDVFPRGHENVKDVDNISLKEMKMNWKEFKNMYQSDGNKLKGCQTGQLWLSGVRQFGPSGRKYAP